MESKGLTIGNLPIKRMKGGEVIPVEHNNENYSITTTDISNYFTEYNLSVIAPTSGIDNGNKYNFELASVVIKDYVFQYKTGYILSFYNKENVLEQYLFCKAQYNSKRNYLKINDFYLNPNNYIGVLKKGNYVNEYVIFEGNMFAGLNLKINFQKYNESGAIVGYNQDNKIVLYITKSPFNGEIPEDLVKLVVKYDSIDILEDIVLDISPLNLYKSIIRNQEKIDKVYNSVFITPNIPLNTENTAGNIENSVIIEQGYSSTYYQNKTKEIQNIIIKGTANPYMNNYPLYGFSNTKPIAGITLENVAVAKKKGEVIEHKTTINPNQYIYINGNENKLLLFEEKPEEEKYASEFDIIRNHNILYNKKFVAAGDSFTEAIFTAFTDENGLKGEQSPEFWDAEWNCWKSYAYHIAKRNEMIFYPNGVSGSTIHDNGNKNAFCKERYKNTNKIPLDTDYLILMFGLNENNLVTNNKIGDKNSVDDTTWWGAWNKVLEYYITNMPYCKIGIIIADAWFHKTLRDELIKIANYWGIPYLDLKGDLQVPMMLDGRYDKSIVNSKAIQLRNKAFQTSDDDHHPNPKCHLYRSTIIENFLRQL